jgi:serine/alanine adding enzyme
MPSTEYKDNLKKLIKKLKGHKGSLSRKIGAAKQNKEPFEHFYEEIKRLSTTLKNLETSLKAPCNKDISVTKQNLSLPSQFKAQHLKGQPENSVVVMNCTEQQWDDYAHSHSSSSIYQTMPIKRVIEETFGHTCHYLAAIDGDDQIQGILPLIEMKSRLFGHFFISVPFFNYGGILSSTSKAEQALLLHAQNLARHTGVSHIEYRHTDDHIKLPSKSAKVAMLLTLPKTIDSLWEEIGTKVRAQIKKAQRQDTRIATGREDLVDDFYRVFSQNMRDLGTPVYSKQLFINMLQYCKDTSIIVVYLNEKPVSTGFLLGWRNTVEIPWASTLRKANQYDCNMLLYWEALKFAINQSYEIFDFGRSDKEANTYRFKKQWGAKPRELHWHYWITDGKALPEINPKNPKFQLIISLWKMLPVSLTRLIGPHIVKSIP